MKILVVEDEPTLRAGLVDLLRGEGHDVEAVADGAIAAERGQDRTFDLVLLDLMLPGLDGLEVCRRLRDLRRDLLILMLTARGAEADKVRGLEAGADDYVTKPFGARELLARIDALGRRGRGGQPVPDILEADGCRIDLGRCEARRDGRTVALTQKEIGVLRLLFLHRDRAVSRPELLEKVWSARADLQTRTVDMTVAKLRQKIEADAARPVIVVTVKGVGYAWGRS